MRIRQHVNPTDLFFETFRGQKPVLDPACELEVEIGCADAQFLFERAATHPERRYVGLEIREDLVHWVNNKAKQLGVRDVVTAVFCHAQLHTTLIFPRAAAKRVFVNFPDPWFKRRHHVRRMVDEVLAEQIAYVLQPGGELFVQTDVWDIAIDAMSAFDGDDRFINVAGEWTFWKDGNPYGVRSWREQNAEETGLPIWRIFYRRHG